MPRLLLSLLLLLLCSSLWAQEQVAPWILRKQLRRPLVWQLEAALSGSFSQAQGAFAQRNPLSSEAGNARGGWGGQLELSQRLFRSPLFLAQLHLGYQEFGMQGRELLQERPELLRFEAQPWRIGHCLGGMAFQAGKYFKVEFQLAFGLAFYRGWQVESLTLLEDGYSLERQWTSPLRLALAGQTALLLGQSLGKSKRLLFFTRLRLFGARGGRAAQLREQYYNVDMQAEGLAQDYKVLHQTKIQYLGFELGLRYQLYQERRHPSQDKRGIRY